MIFEQVDISQFSKRPLTAFEQQEILEESKRKERKLIEDLVGWDYQDLVLRGTDFEVEKIRRNEIAQMKDQGEYEIEFDQKVEKLNRILVKVTDARARDLIILKMLEIKEAPIEHEQCLKQAKELKKEFRIFKELGNRRN